MVSAAGALVVTALAAAIGAVGAGLWKRYSAWLIIMGALNTSSVSRKIPAEVSSGCTIEGSGRRATVSPAFPARIVRSVIRSAVGVAGVRLTCPNGVRSGSAAILARAAAALAG